MMIFVNGSEAKWREGASVALLLAERGHDPVHVRGVAVALNDRVVRKAMWAETVLEEGDRIEIVTAQQGG